MAGPRRDRGVYLLDRGLFLQTLRQQRIGHDGERFTIPVWNADRSQLLNVKFRTDPRYADPDAPKYDQPRGVPTSIYRPNAGGDPVVICEGEFDALALAQLGCDAVTSTAGAGNLAALLRHERLRPPVYIATDQDDAGEEAARALTAAFPAARRLRWAGANDVSEALTDSPSPSATVRAWLMNAEGS